MSFRDRIFLTLTGLLAAYQIVVGIDRLSTIPILAYTVAFGILLIALLLMIILGYDVLESPLVVIISTIIPLSLATGLVWERLGEYRFFYLIFSCSGFLAVIVTRSLPIPGRLPVIILSIVHAIAGFTILLLPILLSLEGKASPAFGLVGLGGGLFGAAGLSLSFLKAGTPIFSRETIYQFLPGLLLLMTACYVAGFTLG